MVYNERVPRVNVSWEIDLAGLFTDQLQFVKSDMDFEIGQKIELVKQFGNSFYVYPVVIAKIEKSKMVIFVKTDYSLSLYEIAKMLGMKTLSRRKGWPSMKRIVLFEKDGNKIILNSAEGKIWKPREEDSLKKDWGIIYYCLNET